MAKGTTPADAIKEFFDSNVKDLKRDKQPSFECATAQTIVVRRALLEIMGAEAFNKMFKNTPLGGYSFPQGLANLAAEAEREFIPGDTRMFFNPDSSVAAFRNENTIYIGNGLYYGHGIGIKTLKQMIDALNESNPKKTAAPDKKAGYINIKNLPSD